MVEIGATQKAIESARLQANLAEEQVSAYQKSLPNPMKQTLLRATPNQNPLTQRLQRQKITTAQEQAGKAQEEIKTYKKGVNQYEQEFNQYLQSDAGKLDYAQQMGLTGTPIKGYLSRGGMPGEGPSLIGYEYDTPYGKVKDMSILYRRERSDARASAYQFEKAAAIGKVTGLTSPEQLKAAGINVNDFYAGKNIQLVNPITINGSQGNPVQVSSLQLNNGLVSFSPTSTIQNPQGNLPSLNTPTSNFATSIPFVSTGEMNRTSVLPYSSNINLSSSNAPSNNVNIRNISLPSGISMGLSKDIPTNQSRPNIWNRIISSFDMGNQKATKEVYSKELGYFVKAESPIKATLELSRLPTATEVKTFNPPDQLKAYGSDVLSKFQNIEFAGKPIWAITSGTPTFRSEIKDGALVPKDYLSNNQNLLGGRVIAEGGSNVQNIYDTFIYGGRRDASKPTYEQGIYVTPSSFNIVSPTVTSNQQQAFTISESPSIDYSNPVSGFSNAIAKGKELTINKINPLIPTLNTNTGEYSLERKGGILRTVGSDLINFIPETPAQGLLLGGIIAASTLAPEVANPLFRTYGALSIGSLAIPGQSTEQKAAAIEGGLLGFAPDISRIPSINKMKFGKYLSLPEEEIQFKSQRVAENIMNEKINRMKVTSNLEDNTLRINTNVKQKGVAVTKELYPTDDFLGTSIEKRNVNPIGNFFRNLVKEPQVLKTFKGDISFKDGVFTQRVDYGKYVKEIKIVNDEGKVTLFNKNNREVYSSKFNPSLDILAGETKSRTQKIAIDEQVNNPLTITDIDFKRRAIEVKNLKKIQTQEDKLDVLGIRNPSLKATKVFGELNTKINRISNLDLGRARIQAGTDFSLDIVKSGARKQMTLARSGDDFIKVSKKIGQRIEYGLDKDIDLSIRKKIGGKMLLNKKISPSINRETSSGSYAEVIDIFVNPKSKILDPAKELRELRSDEYSKMVKKYEQSKRAEQFRNLKENTKQAMRKLNENIKVSLKPRIKLESTGGRQLEAQSMFGATDNVLFVEAPGTIAKSNIKGPVTTGLDIKVNGVSSKAELAIGGLMGIPFVSAGEITINKQEQNNQNRIDNAISPISKSFSETKTNVVTNQNNQPKEQLNQIGNLSQEQVSVSKEVLSPISTSVKQDVTSPVTIINRTPEIKRPRTEKPRLPKPSLISSTKRKAIPNRKVMNELFIATTKRYGKEKVIAVGRNPLDVISRGKRNVLSNLGATLKVKSTSGRVVPLREDVFFRTSKRDATAIVQRQSTPSGGRLSSGGERREILSLRKARGILK